KSGRLTNNLLHLDDVDIDDPARGRVVRGKVKRARGTQKHWCQCNMGVASSLYPFGYFSFLPALLFGAGGMAGALSGRVSRRTAHHPFG
ncbi:MAG: hypothetical protein ACM3JD_02510, partial [Rudaea sp.]